MSKEDQTDYRRSTGSESFPSNVKVRITEQDLTETMQAASADVALEPPDSGDFHESFAIPDGSGDVAVIVGDVTGHGAPASAKAQTIRAEAVAHLKAGDSCLQTVNAANDISQSSDDRYSTLFVAKVSGNDGAVEYANAGHEPPTITDEEGRIQVLKTTGPPLGVVPGGSSHYEQEEAQLRKGGTLVVTTDGVSEARRPFTVGPVFFGHDRVRWLVKRMSGFSPSKIVKGVMRQILHFTKSILNDDVVITALRRRHIAPHKVGDPIDGNS